MHINSNMGMLEDAVGACERIMKTPLPFIYVSHLRTILTVWLLARPRLPSATASCLQLSRPLSRRNRGGGQHASALCRPLIARRRHSARLLSASPIVRRCCRWPW